MSEIGTDSSDVPANGRLWLPPIWSDCPFLDKLPADVEARRGIAYGEDLVVICHGDKDMFYVSIRFDKFDPEQHLAPALNNLAMSRLFAEFGDDKLRGLILRKAKSIINGTDLSDLDSKILARQDELDAWAKTPRSPDRA